MSTEFEIELEEELVDALRQVEWLEIEMAEGFLVRASVEVDEDGQEFIQLRKVEDE